MYLGKAPTRTTDCTQSLLPHSLIAPPPTYTYHSFSLSRLIFISHCSDMLGVSVQFLWQVVSCPLMRTAFHGPRRPIQMLCLKRGSPLALSNLGRLPLLPGMVGLIPEGGADTGGLLLLWRTAECSIWQAVAWMHSPETYSLWDVGGAISGMSDKSVSLRKHKKNYVNDQT